MVMFMYYVKFYLHKYNDMEHEEYTAENYPSFGKKYNNEKAILY